MKFFAVSPVSCLQGEISLPGDKAIAHRAVILSAISRGKTRIKNFPFNRDCLSTLSGFRQLGIKITEERQKAAAPSGVLTVYGKGLSGLQEPAGPIFAAESGTTLRLLLGVLAGQDFKAKLIAGKSLSLRPMLRVNAPLRMMGARIEARQCRAPAHQRTSAPEVSQEEYPPIAIRGGNLKGIAYRMPVASAQVKSALLLAGLYAQGKTEVVEPVETRDHTERMLKLFKADIKVKANKVVIKGGRELVSPGAIAIPGDISSAAFFIVAAAITPASSLCIRNVSLNPGRLGAVRVLSRMGAEIKVLAVKRSQHAEPSGDILVGKSKLRGVLVPKKEIPSLIDELPVLMVAACFAEGKTVFEGVGELRVKETDRIRSMRDNLRRMGANIRVFSAAGQEKIVIQAGKGLKGADVQSFADHRTAMSMVVAGLAAAGRTRIDDVSCINKSFPNFLNLLDALTR